MFRSTVSAAVFKDGAPISLHYSMFIPTLDGQANEEQKKNWLTRAVNLEIIGTYAQVSNFTNHYVHYLERDIEMSNGSRKGGQDRTIRRTIKVILQNIFCRKKFNDEAPFRRLLKGDILFNRPVRSR